MIKIVLHKQYTNSGRSERHEKLNCQTFFLTATPSALPRPSSEVNEIALDAIPRRSAHLLNIHIIILQLKPSVRTSINTQNT